MNFERRRLLGLLGAAALSLLPDLAHAQPASSSRAAYPSTPAPDYRNILGVVHAGGRYNLDPKNPPFLVEGAQTIARLGSRAAKFWCLTSAEQMRKEYPFNSNWQNRSTLTERVNEPQFAKVLSMDFSTIVLVTETNNHDPAPFNNPSEDFYHQTTQEYYDLTTSLLTDSTAQREQTIILQGRERDWLLRGGDNPSKELPIAVLEKRAKQLTAYLQAQQTGVQAARKQFGQNSPRQVAFAIEVNRVSDNQIGLPTITHNVLPHIAADLVSYSTWDCVDPTVGHIQLEKNIAQIRRNAKPSPLYGDRQLFIGEIGLPENQPPRGVSIDRWWRETIQYLIEDEQMRHIFLWQLFCNETKRQEDDVYVPNRPKHRGFWLIMPDGDPSILGKVAKSYWTK